MADDDILSGAKPLNEIHGDTLMVDAKSVIAAVIAAVDKAGLTPEQRVAFAKQLSETFDEDLSGIEEAVSAMDATCVHLTGDETINGAKTFVDGVRAALVKPSRDQGQIVFNGSPVTLRDHGVFIDDASDSDSDYSDSDEDFTSEWWQDRAVATLRDLSGIAGMDPDEFMPYLAAAKAIINAVGGGDVFYGRLENYLTLMTAFGFGPSGDSDSDSDGDGGGDYSESDSDARPQPRPINFPQLVVVINYLLNGDSDGDSDSDSDGGYSVDFEDFVNSLMDKLDDIIKEKMESAGVLDPDEDFYDQLDSIIECNEDGLKEVEDKLDQANQFFQQIIVLLNNLDLDKLKDPVIHVDSQAMLDAFRSLVFQRAEDWSYTSYAR